MNEDQLSSSTAAPAYSSPPVSPTITEVPSRGPTPPPPEIHVLPQEVLRRSSSPLRSHSPDSRPSKMGSRPDRAEEDDHLQTATQRPSMPAPSVSAPAGRLPRLLPQDTSQYTEAYLPTAAVTTSSTSLAELAHLIRLQRYQEQRRNHARLRLHRWLVSSALSARLVHCGELAHRTLVDNFRSDDKKSFAMLYNAFHDVRSSCDAMRRYALLEPDLELGRTKLGKGEKLGSSSTFMHEIPLRVRDELLDFISEIRTNPDFLATRIASLSQQELASLTTFRQALDPIDTVMALQARGKGIEPVQKPSTPSVPSPVERLLSFQRHDPLSALIYTVFANSSGPDSAEDLRRTEVWATTCARLITESKPGCDRLIKSVLDAWAGMREWPGKANLELYLMEMLQDGQFLLDKLEDQSTRSRAQADARTTKDTIAADDFYDMAVKRLFEVIDDEPTAGGMPEGVLEIGNAILRKLEDSKKHRTAAQTFIVSRWFFSTYLLNAIIHPESQGIMTGYHISEHARQKILKEIAIRAQKQVLDMTYNWKQAGPILPEIRAHIENILSRFKNPKSSSKPVLLPAKAITSPRETAEVQPFLVICPSDIITLVNSLFPERRPPSSQLDREFQINGLASSASSISGFSLPFRAASTPGDGSSVLSQSASSMTSDTTSREPLLSPAGNAGDASPPIDFLDGHHRLTRITPTEDCGRRLRMACLEMSRALGVDATSGSCHPCAERWTVLYVSPDGKELRTRLRTDGSDDDDQEEDSPDSNSEDEGAYKSLDLESGYHLLKRAVAQLLEEYEIPKELSPESESKGFSNRTSTHYRDSRARIASRADTTNTPDEVGSKNPYHSQSQISNMIASQRFNLPARHRSLQNSKSNNDPNSDDAPKEKPSVLTSMLEAAMHQCQVRSDFINAHLYFRTLQQLQNLSSPSLTRNGYASLLNYFSREPRDSLVRSATAIEECEAWFVWLKQSQERHDSAIDHMMLGLKQLRDKMWYITDVRNSAGYEEAKNVALALKVMSERTRNTDGRPIPTAKPRTFPKSSTNNFLLKTEAQVLELMAAPADYGGPNKLADEQSDMTSRWLAQYRIENGFCKGEERIHRFCLEIDKCVNKLVGDGILDGPVLWSSELYRKDKELLDSGRQKGDLFLTGLGTPSIASDEEYGTYRLTSPTFGFAPRPSYGNLRAISTRNGSQQSFDSGRWSSGRSIDIMDSHDYFSGLNPLLTIDSTTTFWSPFHAQAQSPSSATSFRPRTASSSRSTGMMKNMASINDNKQRFLLDLKQVLTGLLLSDLGTLVFGHGSETDAWFSGELGEECREEEDRRRKKALARRRSKRGIKGARAEHRSNSLDAPGCSERGDPAVLVAGLQHVGSGTHAIGEYSTSSSDATTRSSGEPAAKKASFLEFPYNTAFQRLLRKFAIHPNPFSKLHALYELQLLIGASLASRSGKYYNGRDNIPTVPQSPTLGSMPELSSRAAAVPTSQAQNLEEAIANCAERRSHSMHANHATANGTSAATPFRSSSGASARPLSGLPSIDMIVEVLQDLFRDPDVRPKTLFRDLQYIASFVPAQILDRTAAGKAFWDTAIAALGLKQDVCRVMVEIADDIVALNTQNRGAATATATATPNDGAPSSSSVQSGGTAAGPAAGSATSSARPATPTPTTAATTTIDEPLAKFTMAHAAQMYIITAKEGDAVAERELAIFYLTHPELLPRTIQPLTRPRDVFKAELLHQRDSRKREDPARSDPMTMCVAQHWMEMSKRGGDQLAAKYLRAREDLERIP